MIEQYLDLSTGHVSKETAHWLDWNCTYENINPFKSCSVLMYRKGEYGWIVYANSEEYGKDVPKDLLKVINYAKKKKCIWIMFDRDGEQITGLKTYNW